MAPRFRVRMEVVHFTTLLSVATLGAFAFSYIYGPSDEEKEKVLRDKYPSQIRKIESQRPQMQAVFDQMRDRSPELDQKVDALLKAGKNDTRKPSTHRPNQGSKEVLPTPTSAPTPSASSSTPTAVPAASWWDSWWK